MHTRMPNYPKPYETEVSIPLPADSDLSLATKLKLKLAADLHVSRMFAGTGDMFSGVAGLVQAVFETKGISAKMRELIILRTAKLLNCPYEWQANAIMAKNAGCTSAEIDAMASDGPVSGVEPDVALICKATDELTMSGTLTDPTLTQLRAAYDDETCRKYVLMIAWFNLLSRFLNGCRVPLEDGDKIGSRTSPV